MWGILVGGLVWAWQEGKIDPIIKTGREMVFGKPPQKATVKDFKFQPVTRQDVHQKVLATGTVSLKTGAEVKIGARISGRLKAFWSKSATSFAPEKSSPSSSMKTCSHGLRVSRLIWMRKKPGS